MFKNINLSLISAVAFLTGFSAHAGDYHNSHRENIRSDYNLRSDFIRKEQIKRERSNKKWEDKQLEKYEQGKIQLQVLPMAFGLVTLAMLSNNNK